MENNFVVYIHYRLDNNNPYYVGEGRPRRPYAAYGRNKFWKRITAKHGKRVEIVKTNLTKAEAQKLEAELIAKFIAEGFLLTNVLECSNSVLIEKRSNPRLAQWNKEHCGEKSPTYKLKRPDLVTRNKTGIFKRVTKPILCIETGQVFSSEAEVRRLYKKPKCSHIHQHLKGLRKTAFGFTWKYLD